MAASGLRQSNERAVLNALALHAGAPAVHLARVTGLGPQSISRILTALESENLIFRGEPLRGQRGQPAIPIHINPRGAYSVGCEIGWRHLSVVLSNLVGERLGEYRRDYPFPDPTSIITEVAGLVRLMTNLVPDTERHRIGSLGLAMPSGLWRNLQLLGADDATAREWPGLDVRERLKDATGLSTSVMNDGNAGCWAELVLRPRPRPDNFAYIFVGTFIGGGIVAEGRLWEGATGNSANLGSILVSDGSGGRQYGHLVSSIYALEQQLAAKGQSLPRRDPKNWNWDELGPPAEDWLIGASVGLAEMIANTAAVSEINLAVVDGVLPDVVLERLIEIARDKIQGLGHLTDDPPVIARGHVGRFAAAMGAAFRPLYRQYFARDVEHLQVKVD